jgi:hypothetical protein
MRPASRFATLFRILSRTVPLLLLLAAASALAQIEQQQTLINPTGTFGNPAIGLSSAMAADGNTFITGGPYDSLSIGAAWIYNRSGGIWSQVGGRLIGTGFVGSAQEGNAVAISGDGNTAAIGGFADNSGVGAVWIFVRNGGAWVQQGPKLVPTGAAGAPNFGWSTALSNDGNTLAVGGLADNSYMGAVWVFTRSGSTWTQQGAKLAGTGGIGQMDQGYSVSISGDGSTLLDGGAVDNGGVGAAWVFTRSGSTWTQQGSKLVGSGAVGAAQQGVSVSLSANGTTAAIGGNDDNSQVGAVWIFTRSSSVWTQQGSKLVGSGYIPNSWQGISTALNGDGSVLASGGYQDANVEGAVWIFTRTAGVWSQLGGKLAGGHAFGQFGNSVSISADGNTMEIGEPYFPGLGSNNVFVRPAPSIVSVKDVPNDQGGQVSIRWTPSVIDGVPNGPAVTAYGIWREVPSSMAATMLAHGTRLIEHSQSLTRGDMVARPARQAGATYYWEYIASEPAHGLSGYSYTATTTSDSLPGSNPYTYFMIEAQQPSAGLYFDSAPDSGYSVDNLAPPPPLAFNGTYTSGSTQLSWQVPTAPDLAGFNLYRGISSSFQTSPANLVVSLGATATSYVASGAYYYKLTAVDIHGNESTPVTVLPQNVTGVQETVAGVFSLARPDPNPMTGSASIRFSLARAGRVSLVVFDASGRRVRTLTEDVETAGIHAIAWDGRDTAGREASAGIYFVRLAEDGRSLVQQVALVH